MAGHHEHHDETPHEHDHEHEHEHGHEHGPGGHSHGTGVLGWLRGTFAHSHSIEDQVDASLESNELGIWALKWSLVGLGVTALLQAIIVALSGSVSLLADTIHNFGDATTSLPLWVAFALARRGASRRFTYGYGKAEDVAGVIIVLVIFVSACIAAYEAIMRFFHPQEVRYLGWVAAAAIVGFLGNEAVAQFRIRVGTQIGSAALVADGQHARVDGFTSLAVLIGVVGILAGFPILDPLVGIAITIAILFIVKDAARAVWRRLIDGIEPEVVTQLERVPLGVPGVRGVHQARARWVGHKIQADLHLAVDPDLTVRDSHAIGERVEAALKEEVRSLSGVVIHICPADATLAAHATAPEHTQHETDRPAVRAGIPALTHTHPVPQQP